MRSFFVVGLCFVVELCFVKAAAVSFCSSLLFFLSVGLFCLCRPYGSLPPGLMGLYRPAFLVFTARPFWSLPLGPLGFTTRTHWALPPGSWVFTARPIGLCRPASWGFAARPFCLDCLVCFVFTARPSAHRIRCTTGRCPPACWTGCDSPPP